MRTSEERVRELHRRMDAMEQQKDRRGYLIRCTAMTAACLAVAVVFALMIAHAPIQVPDMETGGAAASIFTGNEVLGYIVVALLAFLLGALVTVFCFRLKRHREKPDAEKSKTDERNH